MPAEGAAVEVAAAVLERPGEVLLACRPAGKPYAGYWEFPGGKAEPGEAIARALARELEEELGIVIRAWRPWIVRTHVYPHATVRLHFFRVTAWDGEPAGLENQRLAWQAVDRVEAAPLLPANFPVLKALRLPMTLGVSNVAEWGEAGFLARLEAALAAGLSLVMLREKTLSEEAQARIGAAMLARVRAAGGRLVVNGTAALAHRIGADGLHLNAAALMAATVRPDFELVGASCHDRAELEQAAELELDYVTLSPVLPTTSHPGAPNLGWERFGELVHGLPMPVYALGGLTHADLATAHSAGAHGVALLRAAWLAA